MENRLISITIGANLTLNNGTFLFDELDMGDFESVYNDGGKEAGTYTRPNTTSVWTKQ